MFLVSPQTQIFGTHVCLSMGGTTKPQHEHWMEMVSSASKGIHGHQMAAVHGLCRGYNPFDPCFDRNTYQIWCVWWCKIEVTHGHAGFPYIYELSELYSLQSRKPIRERTDSSSPDLSTVECRRSWCRDPRLLELSQHG